MKSILIVLGTFLFSVFVEGFIRIIIIFYHLGEFKFFGISTLPSFLWVIVILSSIPVITWLSGMLTITIASYAKEKHLYALGVLLLLWRFNELIQTYEVEPVWYLISLILLTISGLSLAYLTHKNATKKTVY